MSGRKFRGFVNTLLLFGIVVSDTLFLSEIGLEGSIYNTLSVALCFLFILFNVFRIRLARVLKYGWPILFIALSTAVNAASLPTSSFRSAAATAIVFGLLWLGPLDLNRKLMSRLLVLFLVVGAAVSISYIPQMVVPGIENKNFNGNANGAASYFYFSAALALVCVESRLKWPLVVVFGLFLLSTSGRTGNVALAMSLAVYYFMHGLNRPGEARETGRHHGLRASTVKLVFKRTFQLIPLAVILFYAALAVVPTAINGLLLRISVFFGSDGLVNNRTVIWNDAIRLSLESTSTILFGHGPATISTLINYGSSGSYIEAIGSYGYPFTVVSIVVILVWMRALVRSGHPQILIVGPALLLYGVTDTSIFSGISMLWFLLLFAGIFIESRDSALPVARRATAPRRRASPRHGSASLVTARPPSPAAT